MYFEIFVYLGLAAAIIFGPWLLVVRFVRKQKRYAQLSEEHWELTQNRLADLEARLRDLQREFKRSGEAKAASPTREEAVPANAAVPPPPTVARGMSPEPANIRAVPEPRVLPQAPLSVRPAETVASRAKSKEHAQPGSGAVPQFPLTGEGFGKTPPAEPQPSLAERIKRTGGLEEKLGTNWLNKIGIAILVLGVAFFLAHQLQNLGPAGKVSVGVLVSAALLGLGIFFERNERYRILARAGIGGGWALLFFTAYAMHHVAAARVIDSQAADLVLMLAVAVGMVWHTLRYDSQVVTGLAFLLAYVTVNISRVNVFSLSAGAVLAAALAVLVVQRGWFELEIFGILATYLNHFFWVKPIIDAMGQHRRPFPEFLASSTILCLYWLIFRVSYIARRTDRREQDENFSTLAALSNGGFLLAVMKYQAVRPQLAFWFLLALGAAEVVLGQLAITRKRRAAFIVLTTLGAALLVAAIPFRYSGTSLSVLWIAEALALVLAGIGTDEPLFRRLGLVAMLPPLIHVTFFASHRAEIAPDPKLSMVCLAAAVVCYAEAEWFPRRWRGMFANFYEDWFLLGLSHAGMLMLMLTAWTGLNDAWVGVAWCAAGLALAILGKRLRGDQMAVQAVVLAAAALVRVYTTNLDLIGKFHGLGLRLISVAIIAVLVYVTAPWAGARPRGTLPAVYTWVGSFLVGLLAWYELRPVSVALALGLLAIVLLEVGMERRWGQLLLQAHVAAVAAFLRVFFVNLNAETPAGQFSPRVYTIIPLALLFYYAYERMYSAGHEKRIAEVQAADADLYAWLGSLVIAALMRFELALDWVVTAWAGAAFILMLLAWRTRRKLFVYQTLVFAAAVMFRSIFHNFYERSYFAATHWGSGSRAVIVAAVLLFASLPLAFRMLGEEPDEDAHWLRKVLSLLVDRPEQALFFLPLAMITVLLALEMRSGMITVAWGLEGVVVFMLALGIGQRSYRLAGLGLLLLCVGKMLVIDIWRLKASDRYLTLIILGSALLLVSFLYSRYREAVRQYL